MTRNIKVLGLAIAAVLALSAVVASSASAFTEFNLPEAGTTSLKGTISTASKFKTSNGSISCSSAAFRGMTTTGTHTEIETADSSATTGPEVGKKGVEYSGCTFLGFINVAVNTSGCQYNFHANGTVDVKVNAAPCTTNSVTVEGKKVSGGITFEAAGCKTLVTAQTLSGISYANAGTGANRIVNVTPNVTGIKYSTEGCPSFNGNATNGEYTSAAVPTGGTNNTNEGMTARAATIQ